jgi:hypothetical protein
LHEPNEPIEDASPRAPDNRSAVRWFYLSEGRILGPLTHREMESALAEGRLGPLTVLTCDGGDAWRSAASWPQFEGLYPHLTGNLPPNAKLLEDHLHRVRRSAQKSFALFLILALMAAAHLTLAFLTRQVRYLFGFPFCCCAWSVLGVAGGVKAILLLRRSGRLLLALPPRVIAIGLIGSIGLILAMILAMILIVVGIMEAAAGLI